MRTPRPRRPSFQTTRRPSFGDKPQTSAAESSSPGGGSPSKAGADAAARAIVAKQLGPGQFSVLCPLTHTHVSVAAEDAEKLHALAAR